MRWSRIARDLSGFYKKKRAGSGSSVQRSPRALKTISVHFQYKKEFTLCCAGSPNSSGAPRQVVFQVQRAQIPKPKMIKNVKNHEKLCFFYVFASYTWRMVFILCQIDQLTFPTDSENMNPIRALFLVENHDFNFSDFRCCYLHWVPNVNNNSENPKN